MFALHMSNGGGRMVFLRCWDLSAAVRKWCVRHLFFLETEKTTLKRRFFWRRHIPLNKRTGFFAPNDPGGICGTSPPVPGQKTRQCGLEGNEHRCLRVFWRVIRFCVQRDAGSRGAAATWREGLSSAEKWRGKVVCNHLRCCSKSMWGSTAAADQNRGWLFAFVVRLCVIACLARRLMSEGTFLWLCSGKCYMGQSWKLLAQSAIKVFFLVVEESYLFKTPNYILFSNTKLKHLKLQLFKKVKKDAGTEQRNTSSLNLV